MNRPNTRTTEIDGFTVGIQWFDNAPEYKSNFDSFNGYIEGADYPPTCPKGSLRACGNGTWRPGLAPSKDTLIAAINWIEHQAATLRLAH